MTDDADPRDFEAIAIQCQGCAVIAAEQRAANEAKSSGRYGKGATDGLHIVARIRRPAGAPTES